MEFSILILVHVAFGLFWGGGLLVGGFFLVPSILEAGPSGGAVMAGMMKRRYSLAMTLSAALALLSGLRLYALRYSPEWLVSSEGIVLTLGGLLAISAWAIGLFRQRPLAEKMAALVQEGRPAEIPAVAARFAKTARIAAWHMVAVLVLMAGHRLAAFF
jgi:hypothetical protein